jgi:hypothetical protein
MEEHAAQAAAHHPVGGDRGVDPAGHQHDRAAAHPDRQPALARLAAGEHEHLAGVDLDEDLRVRVLEADLEPVGLVHLAADEHVELLGRDGEALVATARADREGAAGRARQGDRGRDGRLRRLVHPQRPADPDDPGHVGDPGGHPVHRRRLLRRRHAFPRLAVAVREPEHQDSLAHREFHGHAGVPHRRADVGRLHADELLAVLPLEEDLPQLEQNARLADGGKIRRLGGRNRIGDGHPSSLPAPPTTRSPRQRRDAAAVGELTRRARFCDKPVFLAQ